jgi:parallel beta-helix repeat protein
MAMNSVMDDEEKFSEYVVFDGNYILRSTIMSNPLKDALRRKLIYLTSFLLMLSLASKGWSKASNPTPPDGAIHGDTWLNLSWRPGDHAVSHDIYLGENYDDVEQGTGGTFVGNQARTFLVVGFPGFPYPKGLVPGTTYYWRIDEVNDLHPESPWKGDVWSFMITPSTAYAPEPADGARFVDPNVILRWQEGFGAKLHTVYFGDNYEEVSNASGGFPQGTRSYNPGFLELDKTYYWRVDEFDVIATHKGDIWSFTVGAGVPPDVVGGTIYVDAVNGDDNNDGLTPRAAFSTIQNGIDTAEDGDVVLVYPGLYQEEINFMGKSITVQGVAVSPAGVPVLQNPGDFAVSFYSGEGRDSILKNFIISDSFMGVFMAGCSPTISNLTIVNNKNGIEAYTGSEPDISNCIFWNNTDGDLFGSTAHYSCIEAGGEGNVIDDPLFVDPDNGDYHIRSERGRYWPEYDIWVLDKVTSPCVDGGATNADYSNEPTPNGGRINMGAYGGTVEASLSPSGQPAPPPGKAFNPNPADGTMGVSRDVTLNWTPGLNAVSHDVYFGTDRDAVANADTADTTGIYRGRQSATSYTPPGGLGWNYSSYYWRIDEVDSEGNRTTGDVWTFTASIPAPKGRGCFLADTPVWVDGTLVQISKVAAGQMAAKVACLATATMQIEKLEEHEGTFECRDILLESGNRISVVDAHCFMLESGQWIAAQDLTGGLRLKTLNGTVGIKSVATRAAPFVGKVYNLKVKSSDQYIVGKDGVIVRDY